MHPFVNDVRPAPRVADAFADTGLKGRDGAGQRTRRVHIDSLRCLSPLGMNERNRDFDSGNGERVGNKSVPISRKRKTNKERKRKERNGTLKYEFRAKFNFNEPDKVMIYLLFRDDLDGVTLDRIDFFFLFFFLSVWKEETRGKKKRKNAHNCTYTEIRGGLL